jgi:hypothetical protein
MKFSSPSTYHLEVVDHTAADLGSRPEEERHLEGAHLEEVAADRTGLAVDTGLGVALRIGPDPAEAGRIVHPEEGRHTDLGEEHRHTGLAVVRHTGHPEAADHSLAEARHTDHQEERRTRQEPGGWFSRPFDRSYDQWHQGVA